jgi:hypothetical protein
MIWLIVFILGLLLIFAQAIGIGGGSWGFVASFGWLGVFLCGLVWLVRPGAGWWNKQ